ncbi:NAD(P)/FAD-dependent oxidoreductase [Magnetospirillum sp. 64-120]|uniref:NAD(P)/FAD-dependent oxidoreductase n=1 Tax=Magnetospirillum sp. 64-120 TaxID=1895778 RepID=UPI00092C2513|nr:NAD(P)/FAD-dependent oxidoreductase [Magnetospirillum sp. 64-120]OJX79591.1 MAG: FAD-dependent oxidoreductase [Magnetospirillum sp. 64-120]
MTTAGAERIDCAVIGAGVVGLAVARALALAGREVLVLESGAAIGGGVSSRNSEVIHAGMYYPAGSLKARLCVRGNRLLRDFAADHGVSFSMCGKLIVATDDAERGKLADILAKGQANGVSGLSAIPAAQAREMEPHLSCTAALFSADTGIIDVHGLMLALQGVVEAHGGMVALHAPVLGGKAQDDGVLLKVGGAEPMTLLAKNVVVAAGLHSCPVARSLGLANVPRDYLCKGNYFTLTGKMPFSRLVYPVPVAAGLGVHYTLDMAGRGRFGPDVEWVDAEDYAVDPRRGDQFYAAIRRYWPGLADGALEPGYAGIRPKISGPTENAADFAVHGPAQHGGAGGVALYGIESPGLTSSLALAEMVKEMVA